MLSRFLLKCLSYGWKFVDVVSNVSDQDNLFPFPLKNSVSVCVVGSSKTCSSDFCVCEWETEFVRVCVCVCVYVWVREGGREKDRDRVCVSVDECECVCIKERGIVCVCVILKNAIVSFTPAPFSSDSRWHEEGWNKWEKEIRRSSWNKKDYFAQQQKYMKTVYRGKKLFPFIRIR